MNRTTITVTRKDVATVRVMKLKQALQGEACCADWLVERTSEVYPLSLVLGLRPLDYPDGWDEDLDEDDRIRWMTVLKDSKVVEERAGSDLSELHSRVLVVRLRDGSFFAAGYSWDWEMPEIVDCAAGWSAEETQAALAAASAP